MTELFAGDRPDGVILATPNRLHVDGGPECVAAGVPVLVEKPIGDTVGGATRLVEAGERAGVAILTGHHRNHSPLLVRAREIVRSGRLGPIVAVVGTAAAMIFTFANGALGTFLLSDTAASARSWEQTSRENTSYAAYDDEDCYHIAGTAGSLSVPTMRVRTFPGSRSWGEPFDTSTEHVDRSDPLANQISHFVDVIRGEAEPICSGRDGLRTLMVVDAVMEAARTGAPVDVAAPSQRRQGNRARNAVSKAS